MLVLATLASAVLAPAVAAWWLARRWPALDPDAPHLPTDRVEEGVRDHGALRALLQRRLHPAEATGLVLTVALGVVAAGAATVGIVLAMVHAGEGLAAWDEAAARFGAEHATSVSTTVLRAFTNLGGTWLVVALATVVGLVEWRRLPSRALPGFLAVVIGGQVALTNLTKWLVDRARPDLDPLAGFSGASFPSGHSATAAASLAAFALLAGRDRPVAAKAVLAGVATGLATGVAASRVLLGVHWLTDAVAGVALGWAWFALCSIAFGGRLLRFGAPVEAAQDEARADRPAEAQGRRTRASSRNPV